MRRILGVLVGIALTLGGAEVAVRSAAPHLPDPAPWPSPETRLKSAQMEALDCVDVVFLGTSVTEAAVVPELLGVDAYNAALPFGTFRSLGVWYAEFVIPTLCHDLVVVGVPLWAGGADDFDPLFSGLKAVVDHREPGNPIEELLAHSAVYERRAQIKALSQQWSTPYRPERAGLIGPRGNQLGYLDRVVAALPAPGNQVGEGFVDVAGLSDLVSIVKGAGRRVFLMIEPARCAPHGTCPSEFDLEARLATYRAIARTLDVDLISLGIFDDPAEYADLSHLNERGAMRFTAMLSEAMERHGA